MSSRHVLPNVVTRTGSRVSVSPGDATQPLADANVLCGAARLPGPRRTEAARPRREGSPPCLPGAAGERLYHTGSEADLLPRAPPRAGLHATARLFPLPPRHPCARGPGTQPWWGGKTSSQGHVAGRGTDPVARGTVRLFRNVRPLLKNADTPPHHPCPGVCHLGPSAPSPLCVGPQGQLGPEVGGQGTVHRARTHQTPQPQTLGGGTRRGDPEWCPNMDRSAGETCGNGIFCRGSERCSLGASP